MKKQIVTACALIASVAAFATSVTSDNTFGVLKIDVSSTAKEVVIPVPWAAIGSGDNAVKVVDFIMPNGRKDGDKLYWYDASAKHYKVWESNGSGSWTPLTTVNVTELNVETAPASEDDTIARGEAAILVLKEAGSNNPVYLSGQYSTAVATTTIYGLTDEEASFIGKGMSRSTLIAAPKAAACDLNSDLSYYDAYTSEDSKTDLSKSMVGDKIMVFGGTNYTYGFVGDLSKWYRIDPSTGNRTTEGCTIPMGTGAWYIRNNQGNFVIKWN